MAYSNTVSFTRLAMVALMLTALVATVLLTQDYVRTLSKMNVYGIANVGLLFAALFTACAVKINFWKKIFAFLGLSSSLVVVWMLVHEHAPVADWGAILFLGVLLLMCLLAMLSKKSSDES